MFSVSQFLEKFKNLGDNAFLLRKLVAEALKEVLKVDIPEKDIVVKKGVAQISSNPILKQMIYIKKPLILAEVAKKGGVLKDIK